jgi:hypothetical protein
MLLFFESSIRGSLSMIYNRYGKANNKYMKEYDDNNPEKYIAYWDANNLYGWAMSQALPIKNYKWLSDEEIQNFDVTKYLVIHQPVILSNMIFYILKIYMIYIMIIH